jgi:formylglycine-generating enzyme required for sulfatase activity
MTPTSRIFAGFLLCVGVHALAVCSEASPPVAQPDPNLDARVQDLLVKVKRSLRFLKGGTFDMGDWGTETKAGLPYDMDPDSRPLHKVTLDSFSMMAYKVTYDEFDVFTDATGKKNKHGRDTR